MFRNALRQSTKAVGAISASGRVAAVSPPNTTRLLLQQRSKRARSTSQCLETSSLAPIELTERCIPMVESFSPSSRQLPSLFFSDFRLTDVHSSREELLPQPPSTQPPSRPAPMLRPRLRPPRSRRSSSRESVVFRRRLALPRPAVSCLSGTSTKQSTTTPARYRVGVLYLQWLYMRNIWLTCVGK